MPTVRHELKLGAPIGVDQIPSALLQRRREIAQAANDPNALRVITMNLIAVCNDDARCAETLEVLSSIAVTHPGRHFLVHQHADAAAPGMVARVAVDATPTGQGVAPTYSELIDLDARGGQIEVLPSVITSLLESDQAACAWWATPPRFGPMWRRAAHLTDRMVVDSGQLDPWDLMRLVEYVKSDKPETAVDDHAALGDLAWARQKPFMALCAKLFDAPEVRAHFASIERIVVRHAAPAGSSTAIGPALLAAWVRARLLKAGKIARVKLSPRVELVKAKDAVAPPGEVAELTLIGSGADALELAVVRQDGTLVAEARKGAPALASQRLRLQSQDPSWQLAQELQIYAHDRLYEAALIDAVEILRDARR